MAIDPEHPLDADEMTVRLHVLLTDALDIEGSGTTVAQTGPRNLTFYVGKDRYEARVVKKR
jgi:hypothetical protein